MTSSIHNCKQSNTEYHSSRPDTNFCGQNCRAKWNRAQKRVETTKMVNCAYCNKVFRCSRKNAKFCNMKCTRDWGNKQVQDIRREENNKLYQDIVDIPTCVICGWKSRSLQSHLKTHKLTVNHYRTQYGVTNAQIFHSSYTNEKSERMIGENNPGFNHQGTMSSFSKQYKQYAELTEEEKQAAIDAQIIKANETKSASAGYNTRSNFYEVRHNMSAEEAKDAVRERQTTFSLAKCIAKFGEEIGTQVWETRQINWRAALDSLPDDVKRDIERRKALNLRNGNGFSTISQQLFESLNVPDALYGKNEVVVVTNQLRVCRLDYMLGSKVIEFNGDYWHANPLVEKYAEDNAVIKLPGGKQKTAGDIRQNDADRQQELEEIGYEILVIWESDYRRNKQQVIAKCLEFLRN